MGSNGAVENGLDRQAADLSLSGGRGDEGKSGNRGGGSYVPPHLRGRVGGGGERKVTTTQQVQLEQQGLIHPGPDRAGAYCLSILLIMSLHTPAYQLIGSHRTTTNQPTTHQSTTR